MTDREFVEYWLEVLLFWREIQHAPSLKEIEHKLWPTDEKARIRARGRLLDANVALIALQLAAEPRQPLTIGVLGRLIAEDLSQTAQDRARKRVANRIVETMQLYELIHVNKIQRHRTTQYELLPSKDLLDLFKWLKTRFPPPPGSSKQGAE